MFLCSYFNVKMLPVYLVTAVFLLASQVKAETKNFTVRAAISVETLCSKNADKATYEKALEKLNHLKQCWDLDFFEPGLSPEEATELCAEHRQKLNGCIDSFLETFKPCLGSDKDNISKFLVDAQAKYTEYFCQHIFELMSFDISSPPARCIFKFINDPTENPNEVCYDDSEVFGSSSVKEVTKSQLCSDTQRVIACYGKKFDKHCSSVPQYSQLVIGMFEEAASPCKNL